MINIINEYKYKIEKIEKLTPNIYNIEGKLDKKLNFKPGDSMVFVFDTSLEKIRRTFSIVNHPTSETLIFGIKPTNGGFMENKLKELNVGDEIKLIGPVGNFKLIKSQKSPVFISAGSGISGILSIIEDYIINGCKDLELFYCIREEKDFMYKETIQNMVNEGKLKLNLKISSKEGRLSVEEIKKENWKDKVYYLCGPKDMIKTFYEEISREIGTQNISLDKW